VPDLHSSLGDEVDGVVVVRARFPSCEPGYLRVRCAGCVILASVRHSLNLSIVLPLRILSLSSTPIGQRLNRLRREMSSPP
jgi:hypothetical protein